MTGWNLPPGCSVGDCEGNMPACCDDCNVDTDDCPGPDDCDIVFDHCATMNGCKIP